jgi:hypothetical protein
MSFSMMSGVTRSPSGDVQLSVVHVRKLHQAGSYHLLDYLSTDYQDPDNLDASDRVILSIAAAGVRVPKTQESRDGRGV